AAQHQGVDPGLPERIEVLVGGGEQLGPAGDPALDELDEARAGAGVEAHAWSGGERVVVRQGRGGGPGADDPDDPAAGGRRGPAGGREDHLDDGDVVALARVPKNRGAGGITCDHQDLDAELDQVVQALQRVLADISDHL